MAQEFECFVHLLECCHPDCIVPPDIAMCLYHLCRPVPRRLFQYIVSFQHAHRRMESVEIFGNGDFLLRTYMDSFPRYYVELQLDQLPADPCKNFEYCIPWKFSQISVKKSACPAGFGTGSDPPQVCNTFCVFMQPEAGSHFQRILVYRPLKFGGSKSSTSKIKTMYKAFLEAEANKGPVERKIGRSHRRTDQYKYPTGTGWECYNSWSNHIVSVRSAQLPYISSSTDVPKVLKHGCVTAPLLFLCSGSNGALSCLNILSGVSLEMYPGIQLSDIQRWYDLIERKRPEVLGKWPSVIGVFKAFEYPSVDDHTGRVGSLGVDFLFNFCPREHENVGHPVPYFTAVVRVTFSNLECHDQISFCLGPVRICPQRHFNTPLVCSNDYALLPKQYAQACSKFISGCKAPVRTEESRPESFFPSPDIRYAEVSFQMSSQSITFAPLLTIEEQQTLMAGDTWASICHQTAFDPMEPGAWYERVKFSSIFSRQLTAFHPLMVHALSTDTISIRGSGPIRGMWVGGVSSLPSVFITTHNKKIAGSTKLVIRHGEERWVTVGMFGLGFIDPTAVALCSFQKFGLSCLGALVTKQENSNQPKQNCFSIKAYEETPFIFGDGETVASFFL